MFVSNCQKSNLEIFSCSACNNFFIQKKYIYTYSCIIYYANIIHVISLDRMASRFTVDKVIDMVAVNDDDDDEMEEIFFAGSDEDFGMVEKEVDNEMSDPEENRDNGNADNGNGTGLNNGFDYYGCNDNEYNGDYDGAEYDDVEYDGDCEEESEYSCVSSDDEETNEQDESRSGKKKKME